MRILDSVVQAIRSVVATARAHTIEVDASVEVIISKRQEPMTSDEVDATIEYIHRPTEAWLHFMVIGAEKNHYPTYNGIVLAMAIRPNRDGSGWAGDALYYPRDAAFGYEGFAVTANLGH